MDVGSMFDDPLRVERVMSGTPATLFRTWAANWSCALAAAPRAGLPTAGCPGRPQRRRDCQRPPTCFAFPGQWRPRFAASTGRTVAWSRTRCGRWWTGPHAQHRRLRVATCLLSRGPPCPGRSGYNKRLRKLAHTMAWLIGVLGADTGVGDDDLWVVDSTPLKCARSTEGQTLGSGRLGPVRLLRLALPLLLAVCGCICLHLVHGLPLGWR